MHRCPRYGVVPTTTTGHLTTKKRQRSSHRSVKELAAEITAWVDQWNEKPTPFVWTKTAEEILERITGYCEAVTTGTT